MIFVDSSLWIALIARRDDRHTEASELVLRAEAETLVTSSHVRGETWTFVRNRYGQRAAVEFLDRLEHSPRVRVDFVDEKLEREALRWLRRHDERPYSFVDATSFALMKRLRIKQALAFDGDFAAAGFVELRL